MLLLLLSGTILSSEKSTVETEPTCLLEGTGGNVLMLPWRGHAGQHNILPVDTTFMIVELRDNGTRIGKKSLKINYHIW